MKPRRKMSGVKRLSVMGMAGAMFAFGGCDIGEFTTTSTVTLNGREVVSALIQGLILTPIATAVEEGIDRVFDEIEDEN
jgi:hypothetical protein